MQSKGDGDATQRNPSPSAPAVPVPSITKLLAQPKQDPFLVPFVSPPRTSILDVISLTRARHLPPKNMDEERRHREEHERMVEQYKRKEEEKHRERERLMRQRELRMIASQKTWSQDIILNWPKAKGTKKLQELYFEGIPPAVRGRAWQLAIGNDLQLTPELYDILRQRGRSVTSSSSSVISLPAPTNIHHHSSNSSSASSSPRSNSGRQQQTQQHSDATTAVTFGPFVDVQNTSADSDGVSRESTVELIQLDLHRTFPALSFFQPGGTQHQQLKEILDAYVRYRPDIGYVQGMSYIAAMLLLNTSDFDAFCCMANLLHRSIFVSFYRMDLTVIHRTTAIFCALIEEMYPAVATHLKKHKVRMDMFVIDWVLTIFSKALPLEVAMRVWDAYLFEGDTFLYRTMLGVVGAVSSQLLSGAFDDCVRCLGHLQDYIVDDDLIKRIESISVTEKKIAQIASRITAAPPPPTSSSTSATS